MTFRLNRTEIAVGDDPHCQVGYDLQTQSFYFFSGEEDEDGVPYIQFNAAEFDGRIPSVDFMLALLQYLHPPFVWPEGIREELLRNAAADARFMREQGWISGERYAELMDEFEMPAPEEMVRQLKRRY